MISPLLSVTELAQMLDSPNLRVFDASFHLPAAHRDATQEFLAAHIPGAQRFDIDHIADHANPLPHMLPSAADFGRAVEQLGVEQSSDVVVYDTSGIFGAARAWWMFRAFGHERVQVLNGGLPAWQRAHQPLEEGPARQRPATQFVAHLRPELVASREQVAAASVSASAVILDARGAARFRGEEPEPRAGLRSGHIPQSKSLPLAELLTHEGLLKPNELLARLLQERAIPATGAIISSCGSGVTACGIALALAMLGKDDVAVYDGSWAEWGACLDLPVATGP